MLIRIFGINEARDLDRVCGLCLDELKHHTGNPKVNSTIYDELYSGEVSCPGIQFLDEALQEDDPIGLQIQVSDIVEVVDDRYSRKGFYYLNGMGWKTWMTPVGFRPDQARSLGEEEFPLGVYLAPGRLAQDCRIPRSAEELQALLGGHVEQSFPFGPDLCVSSCPELAVKNRAIFQNRPEIPMEYEDLKKIFSLNSRDSDNCHVVFTADSFDRPHSEYWRTFRICRCTSSGLIYGEDKLQIREPVCLSSRMASENGGPDGWKIERCFRTGSMPDPPVHTILMGNCLISGYQNGNLTGLNSDQILEYRHRYLYPESFMRRRGAIVSVPYYPGSHSRRGRDLER